jgi:hypothetical protein
MEQQLHCLRRFQLCSLLMRIVELGLRVRFHRGKLGGVQILGSGVSRLGISVLILGSLIVSLDIRHTN